MLGKGLCFNNLPGWQNDNHEDALKAFAKSASRIIEKPYKTRKLGPGINFLKEIANWYSVLDESILGGEARLFFEDYFIPRKIIPEETPSSKRRGFVTGYFEPEVKGSRVKSDRFKYPLLKRPDDLVTISSLSKNLIPDDWNKDRRFGRFDGQKGLIPYFDRQDIIKGALANKGLEIVFLESAIDAFFIHIQGSARIKLDDGEIMRVSYAAKTGHDYTPIGRVLIDEGEIRREKMSMYAIRNWLDQNEERQNEIMAHNRSYIFFSEIRTLDKEEGPIGAAGVSLSSLRSLAVDRTLHTYGVPIFLNADLEKPFQHLMIAQDTGSAILGAARGDIYFGSGPEAERRAGKIQHEADFYLLWPRHQPFS